MIVILLASIEVGMFVCMVVVMMMVVLLMYCGCWCWCGCYCGGYHDHYYFRRLIKAKQEGPLMCGSGTAVVGGFFFAFVDAASLNPRSLPDFLFMRWVYMREWVSE